MSQPAKTSGEIRPSVGAGSSRWKRWLLWPIAVVLLVITGILVLPRPRVPQGGLVGRNHADGSAEVEGSISRAPLAELKAVSLQAATATSSSMGSSRGGESILTDETIVIFNRSNHLLMQRVGLAVFEALHTSRKFRDVRYLPQGEKLPEGEPLPGLFATLDLKSLVETGVSPLKRFDVRVVATLGSDLAHSHRHYTDSLTPPVISFFWHGEVHSEGVQEGFESSGAQFSTLATEITRHLVESLTKAVEGLRENVIRAGHDFGPLKPSYLPPPEFNFLKGWAAEKVIDGNSLMCPTRGLWRFTSRQTPAELWAIVEPELLEAGWNTTEPAAGDEFWIRAQRGAEVLEIFPEFSLASSVTVSQNLAMERVYWAAYTRRMTLDQIDAALTQWLDDDPTEESLSLFTRHWYRLPGRIEEFFEQHPPQTVAGLRTLADWRLNAGRKDEARRYVLRAGALRQILDMNDDESSWKTLAQKVELDQIPPIPDLTTINQLGLHDLRQTATVMTVLSEVKPLVALIKTETDLQKYLILRVLRNQDGGWSLQQVARELTTGGRSSSSMSEGGFERSNGSPRTLHLDEGVSIELKSRAAERAGEFDVTLTRQ